MAPGNRRHIPVEKKQLLTIMANHMRPSEIAKAAHLDVHTVYRTLETWRTTGKHARIPLELCRPRILTSFDIFVVSSSGLSDIYLVELQQHLFESTGLDVAQTTIRDALLRLGYTRKCVSIFVSVLSTP
ncbi:hypothetical protein B0H13DRAFT_1619200 [Mycena leptocephala]|nr:hypothetical protein B0H13DRAFT_1619200 [Mycena leptocephala]